MKLPCPIHMDAPAATEWEHDYVDEPECYPGVATARCRRCGGVALGERNPSTNNGSFTIEAFAPTSTVVIK